jgi:hypothetical protein
MREKTYQIAEGDSICSEEPAINRTPIARSKVYGALIIVPVGSRLKTGSRFKLKMWYD